MVIWANIRPQRDQGTKNVWQGHRGDPMSGSVSQHTDWLLRSWPDLLSHKNDCFPFSALAMYTLKKEAKRIYLSSLQVTSSMQYDGVCTCVQWLGILESKCIYILGINVKVNRSWTINNVTLKLLWGQEALIEMSWDLQYSCGWTFTDFSRAGFLGSWSANHFFCEGEFSYARLSEPSSPRCFCGSCVCCTSASFMASQNKKFNSCCIEF